MKRLLYLLVAACALAALAAAEEPAVPTPSPAAPPPAAAPAAKPARPSVPIVDVTEVWPNALGAWVGSLAGQSGLGLHYQRWLGDVGFSLIGWGIYTEPGAVSGLGLGRINTTLDYGIIVHGLWKLFDADFTNWFSTALSVFVLAGHQGFVPYTTDYPINPATGYPGYAVYTELPYVAAGVAGLGIQIEPVLFQHISLPIEVGFAVQFPTYLRMQMMVNGALRYRF